MLDVGCGCGATTIQVAQMSAAVVGVDVSEEMLAVGQQRADAAGVGNVEFVKKNLEFILIGVVLVSVLPVAFEVLRQRRAPDAEADQS